MVKLSELGSPKNGQKYFVPTNLFLNFSAMIESIDPISELYGLN